MMTRPTRALRTTANSEVRRLFSLLPPSSFSRFLVEFVFGRPGTAELLCYSSLVAPRRSPFPLFYSAGRLSRSHPYPTSTRVGISGEATETKTVQQGSYRVQVSCTIYCLLREIVLHRTRSRYSTASALAVAGRGRQLTAWARVDSSCEG